MKYWILIILLVIPSLSWSEDKGMSSSIKEVKKQHEARLLELPGVVSVGIGLNKNGQSVIIIGLDGPNAETEAQLPSMLEGYPVEVRIVGTVKAQ